MSEVWRPVPIAAYAGRYEVSSRGRVRSLLTGKVLRPGKMSNGYYSVNLTYGGPPRKQRSESVHRLVCMAFHGPPPFQKAQVNHKDLNKLNNHFENLEWCDQPHNMKHAYDNGACTVPIQRKLTPEQVAEIRATEFRYGVQRELARKFGVHETVISQIKLGKTYRTVRAPGNDPGLLAWEASIRPADGDGGGQ